MPKQRLQVFFSDADLETIQAEANKRGLTNSALVVQLCQQALHGPVNSAKRANPVPIEPRSYDVLLPLDGEQLNWLKDIQTKCNYPDLRKALDQALTTAITALDEGSFCG